MTIYPWLPARLILKLAIIQSLAAMMAVIIAPDALAAMYGGTSTSGGTASALTITGPGVVVQPSSANTNVQVRPFGPGIVDNGSYVQVQTATIPAGTNNNKISLGDLQITAPVEENVTYTTGSNYVFNVAGNPMQYLTLNNNSVVTFTNLPTDTNAVLKFWLVITNPSTYTVTVSAPIFQWLSGYPPTTVANSTMVFPFWLIRGVLWGLPPEGPKSPIIPDTDTVAGALVRDTSNGPLYSDGSQGFLWSEEYVQNEQLTVGRNFISAVGATGAIGNGSTATNLYGAVQLQAPASGDHAAVRTSTSLYIGDGVWWHEARLAIERVPNGAQDSRIMSGITTYKAGAWFGTTNGAWWQASSTNANWVMAVATNGVVSVSATTSNLVINQVVWLGVLTSNLNSTAYFYIGPTKQIMKTNRVGSISGVGMGNLSFGHAAGVQVTKVNGSGTDNRVDIYHQALMHKPSTPY